MKRFFALGFCLLLPYFAGFCEESIPISEPKPEQTPIQPVNIKVEPLGEELQRADLTTDSLKNILVEALSDSNIPLDENLSQPVLVLKVRSIQVGLDVATFFHLNLLEQSMLVRNRALFNATTWSQTALLSCPPEKLKKEVIETVTVMSENFTKEYHKALQPTIN